MSERKIRNMEFSSSPGNSRSWATRKGCLITAHGFPSSTVLCANDRMAIGLLAAADEKGLRIGRGSGYAMRIAGHDDHPLARFTYPPLMTVAQNYKAIAEKTLATLFSLIGNGGSFSERLALRREGKLIMRASA